MLPRGKGYIINQEIMSDVSNLSFSNLIISFKCRTTYLKDNAKLFICP